MLQKMLAGLCILIVCASASENKVKTIVCQPSLLYKCTIQGCDKIAVVNIDAEDRQQFEIDPEKKTLIGKVGNATVDIANITSRHGNENTFIFFGTHADSEFDWILRIDKQSRKMILLAANGNLDGFAVYGRCRWEAE